MVLVITVTVDHRGIHWECLYSLSPEFKGSRNKLWLVQLMGGEKEKKNRRSRLRHPCACVCSSYGIKKKRFFFLFFFSLLYLSESLKSCLRFSGEVWFLNCAAEISLSLFSWWRNFISVLGLRLAAPHHPRPTPLKPQIWRGSCYSALCVRVRIPLHTRVHAATLAANSSCCRLCIPGIAVVDKTVACNINAAFYCGQ